MIDQLVRLFEAHHFSFTDEDELQRGIAQVLDGASLPYEREKVLSRTDRVDFFVENAPLTEAMLSTFGTDHGARFGVGIEIKVDSSLAAVTRQLHRYAQHEEVDGLILVTTKARHSVLNGETMNGKPVRVVTLLAL